MKKITTILLLLFVFHTGAAAQDTRAIVFSLDTLKVDSFFLVETTTFTPSGTARGSVYEVPIFFSDTVAFNLYIETRRQRLNDLLKQKDQIGVEWQEVTDQVTALENLRDSVFRGQTGFGLLRQLQPIPANQSKFSQTTPTSWVVYLNTSDKKKEPVFEPYSPDLPIKNDGVILKPDGTFERVRKVPKKKG